MRTLLIDNHDSFTFNLHHLLAAVNGIAPTVVRNDETAWEDLDLTGYEAIVISPGPGRPEHARDLGISATAITHSDLPVLGVCLGHQALCHLGGGRIVHADEPYHGRSSPIHHDGVDLFAGLPSPFNAVRYHSLAATDLPDHLEVTAWTRDGVAMAVRVRGSQRWGVQFHPESILTEHGRRLLENFRRLVAERSTTEHAAPAPPVPTRIPGSRDATGRPATSVARTPARRLDLRVRCLERDLDTAQIFTQLFARSPTSFWLDSSDRSGPRSRFSFLGDGSGPLAELVSYDVHRRRVTIHDRTGRTHETGPLLPWLDSRLRRRQVADPDLPFDLNLGYVGYLGYELKAETGGADAHRAPTPDAAFAFADRMIAVDHGERRAYLLALDDPEHPGAADRWLDRTEERLRALPDREPSEDGVRRSTPLRDPGGLPIRFRHPPDAYLELITACQREVRDGESYEICLTNELTVPGRVDPLRTYLAYRRLNPAPHAAYLRHPGFSVLSASPERFLRVDRDRTIETRPIKGTAPRADDPERDRRLAEQLHRSEKDRAENLMVVDLSRHDLGAVCELGTVTVPELFAVESYATVHQLVSTVRGRLGPGRTAADAIAAAFPGGSMTGAPKRRTMEIIDRLEAGPRGVYSGALGFLACNGTADLSIVIRTMVADHDRVTIGVGGAIVALSDAEAELREAMLKARAAVATLAGARTPTAARTRSPGVPEPSAAAY